MRMFYKILNLSLLDQRAALRKLYYDWGREVTVLLCAAIAIGLFVYVFQDIVSQEAVRLSVYGEVIRQFVFFLSIFFLCKLNAQLFVKSSAISTFSKRLGEKPFAISVFSLNRVLLYSLFFIVTGYFFIDRFIRSLQWAEYLKTYILGIILIYLFSHLKFTPGFLPRNPSLFRWRLWQILFRNYSAQIAIILSIGLQILTFFTIQTESPPILSILIGYASSISLTYALANQLSQDCQNLWLEKHAGISQELFLKTYKLIALTLTCLMIFIVAPALLQTNTWPYETTVKYLFCYLCLPWLFADFCLIIDPKRPFVQMIILSLMGLFIITTIYIHFLGCLLIPIAAYYGRQHQSGFFYRI